MKNFIIIFLVIFSFLAKAKEVSSITFNQVGSSDKLADTTLMYQIKERVGSDFSMKELNEDVKRLYAMKIFKNINAKYIELNDNSVSIVFDLTLNKKVSALYFEGNSNVSNDELSELLASKAGSYLSDGFIQSTLEAVRELYKKKGYHNNLIGYELKNETANRADMLIKITENPKLTIDEVFFSDTTVYTKSELQDFIKTSSSFWSFILDTGLVNYDEIERDKIRLKNAFWNKGYLDFEIQEVKIIPLEDDEANIDFKFTVGKSYSVTGINLTGNKVFNLRTLKNQISLKTGVAYDHKAAIESANKIRSSYYKLGYADFGCQILRDADYETNEVKVTFNIVEGAEYKIRFIDIKGNKKTKDKVLRRELPIYPLEELNPNMLDVSKSRLQQLNYFDKVDITALNTSESGIRDILVQVEEKNTAKFKIGGGISSDEGFMGRISVEQRNFDLGDSDSYYQGGGQRIKFAASIGSESTDFRLDFTEPWLNDKPLRLDTAIYHTSFVRNDWDESHTGAYVLFTEKVFDDFTRFSYGYKLENVGISSMDSNLSEFFQDEECSDLVSAIRFDLFKDTRDSIINPTDGYDWRLHSEITTELFGATNNHYKLEAKGTQYYSFFDKEIILLFAGKVGVVDSLDSERAPIYERYFLGGRNLRGFPTREVSPADENGVPYGGQTMALGTVELTYPLFVDMLRGAIFTDIGAVGDKSYEFDGVNVGAGIGLRINVPQLQTPIRLDLAQPIVNCYDHYDSKWRFSFDMGFSW